MMMMMIIMIMIPYNNKISAIKINKTIYNFGYN
jgi:hypothetical protein